MLAALVDVNGWAVLAASVAHFILAGVWFMALFGRHYARALGIEGRPPAKPGALVIVGPFACSAVTITTTAVLLRMLGIDDLAGGLGVGLLVALGYLVPMTLTIAINPLFPRPLAYTLVNAPMFVIGSLGASAILVAMR